MPSTLPTENTIDKAVDVFGIGTYDAQRDEEGDHGENSEKREPAGRSLPDDATKSPQTNFPEEWLSYPNDQESRTVTNIVSFYQPNLCSNCGAPMIDVTFGCENCGAGGVISVGDEALGTNVFSPDRALAYPDTPDARLGHEMWRGGFIASADLPGDEDGNFQHFHPKMDNIDAPIETVADGSILPQEEGVDGRDPGAMRKKVSDIHHSELPNDSDNPSARSDYYDTMMPGHAGSTRKSFDTDYIAPTEDMGAYAGKKKNSEDSELPSVVKNDETMDDWLQDLGNFWSGKEIEDLSNPQGFPTTDFSENVDFDRSDNQDGGTIVPLGDSKMFASGGFSMNTRQATHITQVVGLTKDFLKEAGKKDLTKRHVLAFLTQRGLPQYLSSDIIRCLKLSHNIHVKDVLDEFPVYREASMNRYAEDKKKCDTCDGPLDSQGYCTDHNCPANKYTIPAKKTSAAQQTSVARARRAIIDLECKHVLEPEVSSVLRRCAADLTRVLIDMETLETKRIRKADADVDGTIKCFDDHVKESTKTAYDEYCNSCKQSGQPCMSHDEWLHGLKQARMAAISKVQVCGTCRHFAWTEFQMPVKTGSEWHHPACRMASFDYDNWDKNKQIVTHSDAMDVFSCIAYLDKKGGGIYPSEKQIKAANRIQDKNKSG
jgi:hypothetical protein